MRQRALLQSLPEWTLLGEYCGVWDRQVPASEAEETDAPDIGDPLGLGPLLYDKVSDLACSSKEAPKGATDGRPFPAANAWCTPDGLLSCSWNHGTALRPLP